MAIKRICKQCGKKSYGKICRDCFVFGKGRNLAHLKGAEKYRMKTICRDKTYGDIRV